MLSRARNAYRVARLALNLSNTCRDSGRAFSVSPKAGQYRDSRGYTHFQRAGTFSFTNGRGRYVVVAVAGAAGLGYVNSLEEIPYTHRKHSVLVTTEMEKALGKAAFQQIKDQAQESGTLLPAHHPNTRLIRRIGERVVRTTLECKGGGYMQHMQNLDWEFIVIKRQDPNAMVVPGGKVIVHTGLLDIMRTEDELAAVLSHEVAHVVARHTAEKLSQMQLFELLRTLLFWTVGIPVPSAAMHLAVILPNSRKLETEADLIGMQLAAQSCYDPAASVSVFQKLGDAEQNTDLASIPGWLRTHPMTATRVKRVQEEVPSAMQSYELTGCGSLRESWADFVK